MSHAVVFIELDLRKHKFFITEQAHPSQDYQYPQLAATAYYNLVRLAPAKQREEQTKETKYTDK